MWPFRWILMEGQGRATESRTWVLTQKTIKEEIKFDREEIPRTGAELLTWVGDYPKILKKIFYSMLCNSIEHFNNLITNKISFHQKKISREKKKRKRFNWKNWSCTSIIWANGALKKYILNLIILEVYQTNLFNFKSNI